MCDAVAKVKDVCAIVERELLLSLIVADNFSKQGQQEQTGVLEDMVRSV